MSSFTHTHLDPTVRALLDPHVPDQLRLSQQAAHRYAVTAALAEQRTAARRPALTARAVWVRARRALRRPRPA